MYCKSSIFLKQTRYFLVMILVILIVTVNVPAVSAEEKHNENGGWEFQVVPYLWFISASGDITVRGQKADMDLSFSDIWDELNIAGMLAFEGHKTDGDSTAI